MRSWQHERTSDEKLLLFVAHEWLPQNLSWQPTFVQACCSKLPCVLNVVTLHRWQFFGDFFCHSTLPQPSILLRRAYNAALAAPYLPRCVLYRVSIALRFAPFFVWLSIMLMRGYLLRCVLYHAWVSIALRFASLFIGIYT